LCKLQIEVFAVFGLISNKKLIKTQIYANLCKFMQGRKLAQKAEMDGSKQCFCDRKPNFYVQK